MPFYELGTKQNAQDILPKNLESIIKRLTMGNDAPVFNMHLIALTQRAGLPLHNSWREIVELDIATFLGFVSALPFFYGAIQGAEKGVLGLTDWIPIPIRKLLYAFAAVPGTNATLNIFGTLAFLTIFTNLVWGDKVYAGLDKISLLLSDKEPIIQGWSKKELLMALKRFLERCKKLKRKDARTLVLDAWAFVSALCIVRMGITNGMGKTGKGDQFEEILTIATSGSTFLSMGALHMVGNRNFFLAVPSYLEGRFKAGLRRAGIRYLEPPEWERNFTRLRDAQLKHLQDTHQALVRIINNNPRDPMLTGIYHQLSALGQLKPQSFEQRSAVFKLNAHLLSLPKLFDYAELNYKGWGHFFVKLALVATTLPLTTMLFGYAYAQIESFLWLPLIAAAIIGLLTFMPFLAIVLRQLFVVADIFASAICHPIETWRTRSPHLATYATLVLPIIISAPLSAFLSSAPIVGLNTHALQQYYGINASCEIAPNTTNCNIDWFRFDVEDDISSVGAILLTMLFNPSAYPSVLASMLPVVTASLLFSIVTLCARSCFRCCTDSDYSDRARDQAHLLKYLADMTAQVETMTPEARLALWHELEEEYLKSLYGQPFENLFPENASLSDIETTSPKSYVGMINQLYTDNTHKTSPQHQEARQQFANANLPALQDDAEGRLDHTRKALTENGLWGSFYRDKPVEVQMDENTNLLSQQPSTQ